MIEYLPGALSQKTIIQTVQGSTVPEIEDKDLEVMNAQYADSLEFGTPYQLARSLEPGNYSV